VVDEWSRFLRTAHRSHVSLCSEAPRKSGHFVPSAFEEHQLLNAPQPRQQEGANPWAFWELRDLLVAVEVWECFDSTPPPYLTIYNLHHSRLTIKLAIYLLRKMRYGNS
jgi:hypothetical protein